MYVPFPVVPAAEYQRLYFQWYQGHAMFHVVKEHNDAMVEKCKALTDENNRLTSLNAKLEEENNKLRAGFSPDVPDNHIKQIARLKSDCREYMEHIRTMVLERERMKAQAPALRARTLTLMDQETVFFDMQPVKPQSFLHQSTQTKSQQPSFVHQSTQTNSSLKKKNEVFVVDAKSEATQTTDVIHAWSRFVTGTINHEDNQSLLVESKRKTLKVKQVSPPVPPAFESVVDLEEMKFELHSVSDFLQDKKMMYQQKKDSEPVYFVMDELSFNLEDEHKLEITPVVETTEQEAVEPMCNAKQKNKRLRTKANKAVKEILFEIMDAAVDVAETKAKKAKSERKPKLSRAARIAQIKDKHMRERGMEAIKFSKMLEEQLDLFDFDLDADMPYTP